MGFLSASKISIVPSIFNADFTRLAEQIKAVELAGVDGLHLDIMDGHFVPNISFGPEIVSQINRITDLPLDVHLMISDADLYSQAFIDAGADNLTIHYEACQDIPHTIEKIRSNRICVGLSINPNTPVEVISPYFNYVDLILIMSVFPGFGGQKFIPETINRLLILKELCGEHHGDLLIQVDGGLDLRTTADVIKAGTNVIVIGSAIFKQSDIQAAVNSFQEIMRNNELQN